MLPVQFPSAPTPNIGGTQREVAQRSDSRGAYAVQQREMGATHLNQVVTFGFTEFLSYSTESKNFAQTHKSDRAQMTQAELISRYLKSHQIDDAKAVIAYAKVQPNYQFMNTFDCRDLCNDKGTYEGLYDSDSGKFFASTENYFQYYKCRYILDKLQKLGIVIDQDEKVAEKLNSIITGGPMDAFDAVRGDFENGAHITISDGEKFSNFNALVRYALESKLVINGELDLIMLKGNLLKYQQFPVLQENLLSVRKAGGIIIEASYRDAYWGLDINKQLEQVQCNRLGILLTFGVAVHIEKELQNNLPRINLPSKQEQIRQVSTFVKKLEPSEAGQKKRNEFREKFQQYVEDQLHLEAHALDGQLAIRFLPNRAGYYLIFNHTHSRLGLSKSIVSLLTPNDMVVAESKALAKEVSDLLAAEGIKVELTLADSQSSQALIEAGIGGFITLSGEGERTLKEALYPERKSYREQELAVKEELGQASKHQSEQMQEARLRQEQKHRMQMHQHYHYQQLRQLQPITQPPPQQFGYGAQFIPQAQPRSSMPMGAQFGWHQPRTPLQPSQVFAPQAKPQSPVPMGVPFSWHQPGVPFQQPSVTTPLTPQTRPQPWMPMGASLSWHQPVAPLQQSQVFAPEAKPQSSVPIGASVSWSQPGTPLQQSQVISPVPPAASAIATNYNQYFPLSQTTPSSNVATNYDQYFSGNPQ